MLAHFISVGLASQKLLQASGYAFGLVMGLSHSDRDKEVPTGLYWTLLYCTGLYWTLLYSTPLYSTVLDTLRLLDVLAYKSSCRFM